MPAVGFNCPLRGSYSLGTEGHPRGPRLAISGVAVAVRSGGVGTRFLADESKCDIGVPMAMGFGCGVGKPVNGVRVHPMADAAALSAVSNEDTVEYHR